MAQMVSGRLSLNILLKKFTKYSFPERNSVPDGPVVSLNQIQNLTTESRFEIGSPEPRGHFLMHPSFSLLNSHQLLQKVGKSNKGKQNVK